MANQTPSASTRISFQGVRHPERPVQDEWGIFDPKQAGVEALLKKLLSTEDVDIKAPKK